MGRSPPAPPPTGQRLPLKQLWTALPSLNRQQILSILGRMVIRRALRLPPEQEVDHDRH